MILDHEPIQNYCEEELALPTFAAIKKWMVKQDHTKSFKWLNQIIRKETEMEYSHAKTPQEEISHEQINKIQIQAKTAYHQDTRLEQ